MKLYPLVAATLLLLAACGRDDGGRTAGARATAAGTPTTAAARGAASPAAKGITDAPQVLERALLRDEDLPVRFRALARGAVAAQDEASNLCNQVRTYKVSARAKAQFSPQTTTDPVIEQTVTRWMAGDAQRSMDDLRAALQTCPEWQATGQGGTTTTYRLRPLAVPALGEQSLGVVLEVETGAGVVQNTIVIVRRGEVTSSLLFSLAGRTPADPALIELLARRADTRLAAVVS
jgi:hypothetical protein